MTAPHEPFVPEILVGDTGKPLCCLECGGELELRCPEGHKHTANVGALKARAKESGPRKYKPKTCACGASFTPTGPRDVRCPTCKGVPA